MPDSSRILIVEDDLATRHLLVLVFCGMGYAVEAVGGGSAAIRRLTDPSDPAPFDVVLSAISLGDTGGMAILKAARASGGRPEVILMTAYSTVQTNLEALRAGAFDYLHKPCDISVLIETVERAIDHRRVERERDRALQAGGVSLMGLQSRERGQGHPSSFTPAASALREP